MTEARTGKETASSSSSSVSVSTISSSRGNASEAALLISEIENKIRILQKNIYMRLKKFEGKERVFFLNTYFSLPKVRERVTSSIPALSSIYFQNSIPLTYIHIHTLFLYYLERIGFQKFLYKFRLILFRVLLLILKFFR